MLLGGITIKNNIKGKDLYTLRSERDMLYTALESRNLSYNKSMEITNRIKTITKEIDAIIFKEKLMSIIEKNVDTK